MNHRSIPPRLGSQPALSVLCVRRRSRRVVALPRFRFALTPSASLSFAVRLRLGLRRAATVHTLPAIRFRSIATRSFGYVSEGVHASGTRRPHQPLWGSLHGSAISFTGDTPTCPNTKKGGRLPVPLMGSNSYSSKPCTTVSSVLESNAFAASVTGK